MTGTPPYVGLAPFSETDADKFFGRDAERTRVIANLRASRFTLLYARSGVGKSSLLRAGVVTRLAAAPASRLVPFIFSSWSDDPNVELPRALGVGGDGLQEALERRTRSMEGTLLVILDQFEEFFQYHRRTPAAERFADDLARCVQSTKLRAHFLVSIREDAYSQLGDEFKGRLRNVYSNYLHLDDLDERGARAATEEPLRQAGNGEASIEAPLVDQILRDVRRDAASNGHSRYEAAHLQYLLRRLWDEETRLGSSVLRLATLEKLGGSEAIFERHFDEAVSDLGAAEQDALAKAFRFLVTSAGTKRAESAADLADLTGAPPSTVERTLEHLREARILTPVAVGGQTRFELAHDLLAQPALEWRREREKARELRTLKRTTAGLACLAALLAGLIVWALLERAAAGRQADRARANELVAQSTTQLSVDPERSVALASDAWRTSHTPAAERALRRALSASLVRRRLDVGTTSHGMISSDGNVLVTEGPREMRVWRGLKSRTPTVRLPGGGAVISADGGVVAASTKQGVEVVRTDGSGPRVRIAGATSPAVSADGRYIAVDRRGTTAVMNAASPRLLARRPTATRQPAVLAFDPSNSRRLVAGDCVGASLTVWNWPGRARTLHARSGDAARIPRGGSSACLLVVSPNGTRAAQARADGSTTLWDLTRGRRVGRDLTAGDAVRDIAWSDGGERLAIAVGKVAIIFDRTGREVSRTPAHVDFVTSVAFNDPNRDLLVTSSRDGVARVWDARTAMLVTELRGHADEITDAAFVAAGHDVVTLSLDGTARLWEVVQGRVIHQTGWVLDAAFSPDGARIATAAVNGSARVTPLRAGRPVPIRGRFHLQTANSITFDRSGQRVAVAGAHDARTGQIVVADATSGAVEQEILRTGQPVLSAAFSPDGKWLVTTALAAPPALWRLSDFGTDSDQRPTATLPIPKNVSPVRAEFSPDGRTIVTAASDGVARVYDFSTRRAIRELKTEGVVLGATFSPDGHHLLTYHFDHFGRIWDIATGRPVAELRGHTSWISRAAFSPDGRLVVTGSPDRTTRVWDARTGRLLSTQQMHNDIVNSVAFSPDGRLILSGSDDATVRLYRCETCAPVEELMRRARDRVVSRHG